MPSVDRPGNSPSAPGLAGAAAAPGLAPTAGAGAAAGWLSRCRGWPQRVEAWSRFGSGSRRRHRLGATVAGGAAPPLSPAPPERRRRAASTTGPRSQRGQQRAKRHALHGSIHHGFPELPWWVVPPPVPRSPDYRLRWLQSYVRRDRRAFLSRFGTIRCPVGSRRAGPRLAAVVHQHLPEGIRAVFGGGVQRSLVERHAM